MFNNFPPENSAVYEVMWKHIIELDRPQMTVWCMLFPCWVPKATNTQSEYVMQIAFLLHQWLDEHA